MNRSTLLVAIFSAVILSTTLATLASWLILRNTQPSAPAQELAPTATTPTQTPISETKIESNIEALTASVSALSNRVSELEAGQKINAPTSGISTNGTFAKFAKETIYLGSSSTTNLDWIDTGLEVTLNKNDYPSGVVGFFEAGMSIVGGNASARLVNKSTGAIITLSEISFNSSTIVWKSSPAFELFAGTNNYHVQIRSTSGEVANLAGARLILDRK